MYKLRLNKKHDGVLFVLSEDEFDMWITQIDGVLVDLADMSEGKEDSKTLRKIRNNLMVRSTFDKAKREAECSLTIYEFEVLVHFLSFDLPLPSTKSTPFKQALKNPIGKKKKK